MLFYLFGKYVSFSHDLFWEGYSLVMTHFCTSSFSKLTEVKTLFSVCALRDQMVEMFQETVMYHIYRSAQQHLFAA